MNLVASCAFGLEALVAREVEQLGCEPRISGPGQVDFEGDWEAIARVNLWSRCADRVSIVIAEFPCADFDALFDITKGVDWLEFLAEDAAIHVTGSSLKSALTSVPAIQRTVKKAIVDSVLASGRVSTLPESGSRFRVHVGLRQDEARIVLDTTGPSLHKRGYREISTKAPLKETLAAALVQLSFWKPDRPLIDPFCGGGTIVIEAAMIGRNLAPGLRRDFAFEQWNCCPPDLVDRLREEARDGAIPGLPERIIGSDIHQGALSIARRNAVDAGVDADVHFQPRSFQNLTTKKRYGCVITNPPYGDRLDPNDLGELYEAMPLVLSKLPTWSHFILTAFPNFEQRIGRAADRRRKLYNGRIECTYYQFHGPRPGERTTEATETKAVFGGQSAKSKEQAELFASRLKNRARHLRRWPTRRGITCYRLYEKDIPEIPLVVDRYQDYLHIVEFERPHERDNAEHALWLDSMAATAAAVLDVPKEKVFTKSRQRQRKLQQHEKVADRGVEVVVHEAGLRFIVNLSDYTDTGLFLDHRIARGMIRDMSEGQRVLNLFAYTGAFSVYAAAGGATEVVTVDRSKTYLDWARRNLRLNDLDDDERYRFVRNDAEAYVQGLPRKPRFDLIVCDVPTFSNSKGSDTVWDVQKHHAGLLNELMPRLAPDGTLFFASNFRRLRLDEQAIQAGFIREVSKQTVPEDFRNRRIHRSWLLKHG